MASDSGPIISWRAWLCALRQALFGLSRKRSPICRHRYRPVVEGLEARLAPASIVVTDTADLFQNQAGNNPHDTGGMVSLRSAIAAANVDAAAGISDSISFATAGNTISLAHGQIELTAGSGTQGTIQINGTNGASEITVDGGSSSRIFLVDSGAIIETYQDLTIAHGFTNSDGGGIYNAGALTVTNCVFANNNANFSAGGAIENASGTLAVSAASFTNNTATSGEAAAIDDDGMLTLSGSSVTGSSAGNGVGGIRIDRGATATISNTSFTGNANGAIENDGTLNLNGSTISNTTESSPVTNTGTLTVTGSTFANNVAPEFGAGGIYNSAGSAVVTDTTFTDNSVSTGFTGGGAIFTSYSSSAPLTIIGCTFTGNSAPDGGAIDSGSTLTVTGSTFSANSATVSGGAIMAISNVNTTITDSTFFGNTAGDGGAIYATGTFTISNSTITGNSASDEIGGGGIEGNFNGTLTLFNTIVAGNTVSNNTASGPDVDGAVAAVSAHNLIGAGDGRLTGISNFDANNNQVGTVAAPLVPLLTPLGNFGGPTQTMALGLGSPAIGVGGPVTTVAQSAGGADTTIVVADAAAIASTAGPYAILIDGEEMTVTNVDLTTNTLTVTRAVNSISASPTADDPVYLFSDQRGVGNIIPPDIGASNLVTAHAFMLLCQRCAGAWPGSRRRDRHDHRHQSWRRHGGPLRLDCRHDPQRQRDPNRRHHPARKRRRRRCDSDDGQRDFPSRRYRHLHVHQRAGDLGGFGAPWGSSRPTLGHHRHDHRVQPGQRHARQVRRHAGRHRQQHRYATRRHQPVSDRWPGGHPGHVRQRCLGSWPGRPIHVCHADRRHHRIRRQPAHRRIVARRRRHRHRRSSQRHLRSHRLRRRPERQDYLVTAGVAASRRLRQRHHHDRRQRPRPAQSPSTAAEPTTSSPSLGLPTSMT